MTEPKDGLPSGPSFYGIAFSFDWEDHYRRAWDEFIRLSYSELEKAQEMHRCHHTKMVKWRDEELVLSEPNDEQSSGAHHRWRSDMAHCQFSIFKIELRLQYLHEVQNQIVEDGRGEFSQAEEANHYGGYGVLPYEATQHGPSPLKSFPEKGIEYARKALDLAPEYDNVDALCLGLAEQERVSDRTVYGWLCSKNSAYTAQPTATPEDRYRHFLVAIEAMATKDPTLVQKRILWRYNQAPSDHFAQSDPNLAQNDDA